MSDKSFSDETLQQMVKHIKYEMHMLKESTYILKSEGNVHKRNIALESFVVHVRNLLYFFCYEYYEKKKLHKDDLLYSHYISNGWRSQEPPFELNKVKQKCDQQLAHITVKRLGYDVADKGWPCNELYCYLLECWKGFQDNLPERMRPWFQDKRD
jgi:hypothetical protein